MALSQVCKYWIEYAGLDGKRVDTLKRMGGGPTHFSCTLLHEYTTIFENQSCFFAKNVTSLRPFGVVE